MAQEETAEKPKVEIIAKIDSKGLFSFGDHKELGIAAALLIQTGYAPDHLRREGKEAVAAALLLCKQYELPQKAMNQMAFIKGKLTCFGSLVTALSERHKDYGQKREFFIDEEFNQLCVANKNLKNKPWAAVVQIKKKGSDHWSEYFFSLDDAYQAGLFTEKTKDDSGWVKYTKDLLMHKARKRALSSEYASAIEGIEYFEDVKEAIDITPTFSSATHVDSLNSLLEEE